MPTPRINGTLEPVKQPTEYVFDPTRGYQRIDRWESAGNNLWGIAAQMAALGIGYQFTPSAAKSVLIAQASGAEAGQPEATTDTWQIVGNEIQKDLFEHPRAAALDGPTIEKIRTNLENHKSPTTITPPFTGDAALVYDLEFRGTTHYAVGQYVLRHTTNVSNSYAVNVSDVNVERIYTTAQLITECANPNSWAYPIPGRLQYKLQNITAPTVRSGYLWGWRKLPSTETTAAGNRIEIVTEYWLEQWSTLIYSTVPT